MVELLMAWSGRSLVGASFYDFAVFVLSADIKFLKNVYRLLVLNNFKVMTCLT